MKSYLIVFMCTIVLMLCLSSATSKKSNLRESESNELQRPDPSSEPLPKFWTTGNRPTFPIQMNKKYKKYHSRLSSLHRYKDHTKSLLKKKARKAQSKKVRKNKHKKNRKH